MRKLRKLRVAVAAVTALMLGITDVLTLVSPSQHAQYRSQSARHGKTTPDDAIAATAPRLAAAYGKLPLSFEANFGQTDAKVKFLSRGKGYTMFLTGRQWAVCRRGVFTAAELHSEPLGKFHHHTHSQLRDGQPWHAAGRLCVGAQIR